ncbi:translation initiation factor IF-2 subunit alpha [Candidatus Woesearchaeota archaeon]|nr:translation initiation factor IF-2 subunit alpha [Candidatus Woesearchaeota archaeon]
MKKKGLPEEDDLVLCTVTKIFPNGVFANLDEYDNTGMIHISEVAPGRIRNIREYVREGKKIVCKVLRVNREKGQVDLSLRRVNEGHRREKINSIKLEQKACKIIEYAARKLGKKVDDFLVQINEKVTKKYPSLYSCFDDVAHEKFSLDKLGIPSVIASQLTDAIKERLKPPMVSVVGELKLKSHSPDGIAVIKKVLMSGIPADKDKIAVTYLGGGRYHVVVTAQEYKDAEKALDRYIEGVSKIMEDAKGLSSFTRAAP